MYGDKLRNERVCEETSAKWKQMYSRNGVVGKERDEDMLFDLQ